MLRRLYRCILHLHPSSFQRRFSDEMLYIFDQQKETLDALNVVLDGFFSVLKQWTLRTHSGMGAVSTLPSSNAEHFPLFATFDTLPPRGSALIYGAMLAPILFCAIIFAIPSSGIRFANQPMPWMAVKPTQALDAPEKVRGVTIWLDQYAGKYVSKNPPETISIQIAGDGPGDHHLTLSLAGEEHSGVTLLPLSPTRFFVIESPNSYVDFTADPEGGICCLSLAVNGKAIRAQRQ